MLAVQGVLALLQFLGATREGLHRSSSRSCLSSSIERLRLLEHLLFSAAQLRERCCSIDCLVHALERLLHALQASLELLRLDVLISSDISRSFSCSSSSKACRSAGVVQCCCICCAAWSICLESSCWRSIVLLHLLGCARTAASTTAGRAGASAAIPRATSAASRACCATFSERAAAPDPGAGRALVELRERWEAQLELGAQRTTPAGDRVVVECSKRNVALSPGSSASTAASHAAATRASRGCCREAGEGGAAPGLDRRLAVLQPSSVSPRSSWPTTRTAPLAGRQVHVALGDVHGDERRGVLQSPSHDSRSAPSPLAARACSSYSPCGQPGNSPRQRRGVSACQSRAPTDAAGGRAISRSRSNVTSIIARDAAQRRRRRRSSSCPAGPRAARRRAASRDGEAHRRAARPRARCDSAGSRCGRRAQRIGAGAVMGGRSKRHRRIPAASPSSTAAGCPPSPSRRGAAAEPPTRARIVSVAPGDTVTEPGSTASVTGGAASAGSHSVCQLSSVARRAKPASATITSSGAASGAAQFRAGRNAGGAWKAARP